MFDGSDENAPALAVLTGKELPTVLTSSGPDVYLRFTSNDNGQALGFRAAFACTGDPLKYWRPAAVATELSLGIPTTLTTPRASRRPV